MIIREGCSGRDADEIGEATATDIERVIARLEVLPD